MKLRKYFDEFCDKHGYTGDVGYNKENHEYHIIISKDDNNAGAFMTKQELESMNNNEIEALLNILHDGFTIKFAK